MAYFLALGHKPTYYGFHDSMRQDTCVKQTEVTDSALYPDSFGAARARISMLQNGAAHHRAQ